MINLLFIALGYLSKGDMTIAAEFAKRLPKERFAVRFVTSKEEQAYIEQLGLETVALAKSTPEENFAVFDQLMASFQPHYLIAADVYTLEYSVNWSGLHFDKLREKYSVPIMSFDQYEWASTNYSVDFYQDIRAKFPPLIDACDYLIRNCPLNRLQPAPAHIFQTSLYGDVRLDGVQTHKGDRSEKIVFITNSKWEYVNVHRRDSLEKLIPWMPKIIHNHLASLKQPLTVIHIGPINWDFPIADHIKYCHYKGLPPQLYKQYLHNADLFVTTNLASVTLSRAVFAGVPSLVLQNYKVLDFRLLKTQTSKYPDWFVEMGQQVKVAYPYRIFPWGWFSFLGPVMEENAYADGFVIAPLFELNKMTQTLNDLLNNPTTIRDMKARQQAYVKSILELPTPEEVFDSIQ